MELEKVCSSSSCYYFRAWLLTAHISTTESPTDEDLPNPGSLFASRTLPPLSHILPRPYPRPRPPEWTSPSHWRDSGSHLHHPSLQGDGWPPRPVLPPRAPLEGNASHDAQRFVSLVRMRDIHLIHVHRSRHSLQELSIDSLVSPASPDTPITFMVPQTGPTPPNFPTSESQRRRGFRSRHPPPPPEDAPRIQCRWVRCGVWLAYDRDVISCHVNKTHKRGSQELICQWENPGGGVCGTSMQPVNLRKHTLDIHTTLMTAWCEGCGKAQRKDSIPRHKKRCEGYKGGLPKPE